MKIIKATNNIAFIKLTSFLLVINPFLNPFKILIAPLIILKLVLVSFDKREENPLQLKSVQRKNLGNARYRIEKTHNTPDDCGPGRIVRDGPNLKIILKIWSHANQRFELYYGCHGMKYQRKELCMKKISKMAIIGVVSLASVVAAVGLAGAATYSKNGYFAKTFGTFANKGGAKVGPRGFMDLNLVSQDLGIAQADLKTDLMAGKSINEIADEKGVTAKLATLTTDLEKTATDKIDQAAQANKITSDQANTMKANIAKQVQDFLANKGLGREGKNGMAFRGAMGFMDISTVAKDLNLNLSDLTAQLKSGKSINDIAKAQNSDIAALTTDLEKAASDKIDQAVQANKITSDQANTLKTKIPQQVQNFLSATGLGMDRANKRGFGGPRGFMDMSVVTKNLGMTISDLTTELKTGKSISDVATAKNVDLAKLKQDLTVAASAKIDQAVQANSLSSDKAKTIKDNLPKQIEAFLSNKGHINRTGHKGFSAKTTNNSSTQASTATLF